MNHAIEILEERAAFLKNVIRTIRDNGHLSMQNIPCDIQENELAEVNIAIQVLKAHVLHQMKETPW